MNTCAIKKQNSAKGRGKEKSSIFFFFYFAEQRRTLKSKLGKSTTTDGTAKERNPNG